MNRRHFFKSCGGEVAALMLPFGLKVKTEVIGVDFGSDEITLCWYQSIQYSKCMKDSYLRYIAILKKRIDDGIQMTPPIDLTEL